ncbi:MAG: hypothetical protein ABSE16_08455 [Verrucomicrobiota bacterium]
MNPTPLRSGSSVGFQWRVLKDGEQRRQGAASDMWGRVHFPAASANGRARQMFQSGEMFPFRIYQLPESYRAAPNPAADWLLVCVRAGYVSTSGTPVLATGGDNYQWGYEDVFPVSAGAGIGEVALTAGVAQTWFWVTTGSAPAIASGAALPGSGIVPIGYVDSTNVAAMVLRIRQIQYGDVQASGGGGGSGLPVWL